MNLVFVGNTVVEKSDLCAHKIISVGKIDYEVLRLSRTSLTYKISNPGIEHVAINGKSG